MTPQNRPKVPDRENLENNCSPKESLHAAIAPEPTTQSNPLSSQFSPPMLVIFPLRVAEVVPIEEAVLVLTVGGEIPAKVVSESWPEVSEY